MNKLKLFLFLILFVSQNCFSQNTKIPFDPSDNFDSGLKSPIDFWFTASLLICFIAPYYIAKKGKDDGRDDGIFWKWLLILFTALIVTLILFGNKLSLVALIVISIYGLIFKSNEEFKNNDSNINKKHTDNESENLVTRNASNKEIYEVNLTSKEFLTKKPRKEVQKTKIIYCPNCAQRLKLNVVVNTELDITCPSCRNNWIGTFKVLK